MPVAFLWLQNISDLMSSYTVTIDLPGVKLGDEWSGLTIGPLTVDGIGQGNLTRISMWLVGKESPTPFILDTDGSGDALIVIDTAAAPWEAHINPVDPFLPRVDDWSWTLKFYHSGNVSPLTLYEGVLKVGPTTNP